MQVVDALDEDFASFLTHMTTSHCCTTFAYDVSCIIGKHLNTCMKASATVSLSDPGG